MAARTTSPAPTAPRTNVLLVTIGERRGDLFRWQRQNKVRAFRAHLSAPAAGNAPAKKNHEPREYGDVIARHLTGERAKAEAFIAQVMDKVIALDDNPDEPLHVLVVIDKVACTYDPEGKVYPSVAGPDTLADLRTMADEVIMVG